MSSTVKVFKNVLSLLSERVVVPLVNLLLVVSIARYLGAEGLGRYSLVVGFVSFFDIFLDLGINTLIIRDVARDKSSAGTYVSKAITLKLAVVPAIMLSISVFLGVFPYTRGVVLSFYVFSAAFILFAFSDTVNALYKAFERMDLLALMVFLRQTALILAVVLAMELGYGIKGIAFGYLAVSLVYLAANYLMFNLKVARVRPGLDRTFYADLFNRSLPFIMLGFFFLIFYRIDVVLVSVLAGDEQAGLFSSASKVVSSLLLLSAAFLEAVFPIISRYEPGSAEKMRGAVVKAFHLLAAVSFPMAVGLIATGGDVLSLLYGEEFRDASDAFFVLSAALPLAYLSSVFHYVLIARDRQRRSFFAVLAVLVLSCIANYWLVKYMAGLGAAIATLGFTAALFLSLGYMVLKDLDDYSALTEMARPFAAAVLMGGLLYFMDGLGLVYRVLAGAAVYCALMWLIKGFNSQDISHVRDLWEHYAPASGRRGGKA